MAYDDYSRNSSFASLELLGWKLSPIAFYHQLKLRNTTGHKFQHNIGLETKSGRTLPLT